jgi:DNA mismatch repair ATPase MutS
MAFFLGITLQLDETRSAIVYTHSVGNGPSSLQDEYGIHLAEMCGFPEQVVQCARTVKKEVLQKFPNINRISVGKSR